MVGTIAAAGAEERWGGLVGGDDREAADFEAVWTRHGRALFATASRMLRRAEDAEEVVQDAFLAYHNAAGGVRGEQAGAWLHRVVVNGCLDRLRRGGRWKTTELTDEWADARPEREGLGLDLEAAVAGLPEKARLVFLLHDVEGLNHRELAGLLGLNEGTSKSQLFRARRMLRERMRGRR